MREGCTNPSRPSVVSGERVSRGSDATKSRGELDRVHELSPCRPRMLAPARDMHLQLRGRERLDLELTDARSIEGVGGLGAERLDVEVVGTLPDLLVDREADPRRCARLRCSTEAGDRCHDLCHAGLVVGPEERRAVTRDDVVPDARGKSGLVGGVEHLARIPGQHDGVSA